MSDDSYLTKKVNKHIKNSGTSIRTKINEEYEFQEIYLDCNGNYETVTVILHIDHRENNYTILPINGDMFNFQYNTYENYERTLAILAAIKKALEFGRDELK